MISIYQLYIYVFFNNITISLFFLLNQNLQCASNIVIKPIVKRFKYFPKLLEVINGRGSPAWRPSSLDI